MTADQGRIKLAREMHSLICTGRWVLEQQTGEQLDQFRRPCAASTSRERQPPNWGLPLCGPPKGAAEIGSRGAAVDHGSRGRTCPRSGWPLCPFAAQGVVRHAEKQEGAVLLRCRRQRG